MLLPACTNLSELISCLSNHTGENKHTFHSQAFTFAWAALWSVFLSAYSCAEREDKKQTADGIHGCLWSPGQVKPPPSLSVPFVVCISLSCPGLFCDNAVLYKFPTVIRAHQIRNNDTFLKLTPIFE